jgi:hypothetical protein
MAQSNANTVEEYLAELPDDRRAAIKAVRKEILANLPAGFVEKFALGMIVYVIPLEKYPNTYNKQPLCLAAVASQKNYMTVYLMNVYGHKETEQWFRREYEKTGKKLDMGKSCVRFKRLDDLALDLIGQAIGKTTMANYIEYYEASRKK